MPKGNSITLPRRVVLKVEHGTPRYFLLGPAGAYGRPTSGPEAAALVAVAKMVEHERKAAVDAEVVAAALDLRAALVARAPGVDAEDGLAAVERTPRRLRRRLGGLGQDG